jgi:putative membrane protein
MSSETPASTGSARRLHWSSLFFSLGPIVRNMIPLLIFIFATRGFGWRIWLLLTLIPGAIEALIRYFTYTYRIDDQALTIASGVLERKVRHIPHQRIQHVELKQGPLQRLLGVAEVVVQSGGTSAAPEAKLTVLSMRDADELRRSIEAAKRLGGDAETPAVSDAEAPVMLRLELRDLVLCGLAQGRGWLVVGGAIALGWQVMDTFDIEVPTLGASEIRTGIGNVMRQLPSAATWLLLILGVTVLFRVLSVGWAIVRLYGFTLTREGDLLRSRFGLLTKFSTAIPRRRVQLLAIIETPLQRLARRAAVRVETAAKFANEQGQTGAEWLAPVIARDRVAPLVTDVLLGINPDQLSWTSVATLAARRVLWESVIVSAMVTAGAVWAGGWSLLVVLPIAVLMSWSSARATSYRYAYSVDDEAVAFRRGWLTHRMSIVRMARVQSVKLSESWLDRRWGMASVAVDTAGASGDTYKVNVHYLSRADAERLFARIREAAARFETHLN